MLWIEVFSSFEISFSTNTNINFLYIGDILYDPNDSMSEKLNGTRIQEFFIKKMYHYCKLVLGWDDCGLYELSGCGINSDCPPNTRLMNSFLLLQQSTDYIFFFISTDINRMLLKKILHLPIPILIYHSILVYVLVNRWP